MEIVLATLDDLYDEACNKVSDCFKHCPVIYELSTKCQHVTELGLNSQPITISVLAAQPREYVAYGEDEEQVEKFSEFLNPLADKTELKFRQGHSLEIQIEPTDMLIVDTFHSSPRLQQELAKHAGNVKRYMIFPSTYAYAVRGEDGSYPGLADVIMDFIQENPEWEIIHKVNYNNGMIVLEREPRNSPEFERMYSMVNFDIPDVRWVERHVIGLVHPDKGWTADEIEAMAQRQLEKLNRALRYGVIIGVERNFTILTIDDKEIMMGYIVYHVGFRNRPRGK